MTSDFEYDVFRKGSKTYYYSSLFFPKDTRSDIAKLYSFVRIVDDLVDDKPQQLDRLNAITTAYNTKKTANLNAADTKIVNTVFTLEKKYHFAKDWIPSFLESIHMDANNYVYKTESDTLKYIYGSAEVIGLMMSAILGLDKNAYKYAQLQGRAMQYINFIRDIDEDIELGRCYFAKNILKKYNIEYWDKTIVNQQDYKQFVLDQLEKYHTWQTQAEQGWQYIPKRMRVAVITAADMYKWTGQQIALNPKIVFDRKVKPSKTRILARGISTGLSLALF